MSGAANAVKNTVSEVVDTTKPIAKIASMPFTGMANPLQVVQGAKGIIKGARSLDKGVGAAVGAGAREAYGEGIEAAMGQATGLIGGALGQDQELPNIAEPVDPAKIAADAKRERARVKRQTEVDLLTNKPGRGGTILTDQYTYNV